MFTDPNQKYIYFYSGSEQPELDDGALEYHWCDPYEIAVYNIASNSWMNEIIPIAGSQSSIVRYLPNILFSSRVVSTNGQNILMVGGNNGNNGPFEASSHDMIFDLDISALRSSPLTGSIVLTVLPQQLPEDMQFGAVD